MMNIEKCMQQRSDEWLAMRKNYIGASDAPAILGISPYMTAYELWLEKLGLGKEREVSAAMQRGIDLEAKALEWVNYTLNHKFEPSVKFHSAIPYMMASLDGEDKDIILEIKCNGRKVHEEVISSKKVPLNHYAQIQHQLEVCGVSEAIYCSFNDDDTNIILSVKRDDEFIKDMLEKQARFWKCVKDLTPPTMTERDRNRVQKEKCVDMSYDKKWEFLSWEYRFHSESVKSSQEKADKAKEELIELAEERNCFGNGIRLSKVEKKGSIDYGSIPELKDIDLEKYRKPSTTYWRIENE